MRLSAMCPVVQGCPGCRASRASADTRCPKRTRNTPMLSDMTLMPQRSYSRGPTDVPLLNETIGERLRTTAALHPDREALVVRHQEYVATYSELYSEVDRIARGLLALGVEHGDRVAIWAPNRYEWAVTQFATARIGAVLVTINPAYRSAELRYALAQGRRQHAADGRGLPRRRLPGDPRRGPRRAAAVARRDRASIATGTGCWRPAATSPAPSSQSARRASIHTTRSTSSSHRGRPARPRA